MKLINNKRFDIVVCVLSVFIFLLLSGNVLATNKKEVDEAPKPQVYPFTDDEPACPSGNCDRSNENPKDDD